MEVPHPSVAKKKKKNLKKKNKEGGDQTSSEQSAQDVTAPVDANIADLSIKVKLYT